MKINPLHGARCYLGGPIENDNSGHNWRTEPTRVLTERFGIQLFDPFIDPKQQWSPMLKAAKVIKDYEEMKRIAKQFVSKDLNMVDRTDFLVSYLPQGVPTTGTHHEIIYSNERKKPTLLVCPQGKENVPLWYYGFIDHNVMFGSWQELYDYLDEVNKGLHDANRRWHYLYEII